MGQGNDEEPQDRGRWARWRRLRPWVVRGALLLTVVAIVQALRPAWWQVVHIELDLRQCLQETRIAGDARIQTVRITYRLQMDEVAGAEFRDSRPAEVLSGLSHRPRLPGVELEVRAELRLPQRRPAQQKPGVLCIGRLPATNRDGTVRVYLRADGRGRY